MNKKGDITTTQIVTIVLAVVGFVIVLGFIYYLNFGQQSEQEICHLSVLGRATAPTLLQAQVPLKCTISKICLTNREDCKQFLGEDDVIKVKLPREKDKAARLIEETSANAMYTCWNMMGQGKLDLFHQVSKKIFSLDAVESTCVICSRVAVSEDVDQGVLNDVNINEYLKNNEVVPGITYLEAFTGDSSVNSYADSKIKFLEGTVQAPSDAKVKTETALPIEINTKEKAFVFMQIKVPNFKDVLLNDLSAAGFTLAGAAFVAPKTTLSATARAGRVLLNPYVLISGIVIAAGFAGYQYSNIAEGERNVEQLVAAGYCGDARTEGGKTIKGCSTVQGIDYSVSTINKLCGGIQGNP